MKYCMSSIKRLEDILSKHKKRVDIKRLVQSLNYSISTKITKGGLNEKRSN